MKLQVAGSAASPSAIRQLTEIEGPPITLLSPPLCFHYENTNKRGDLQLFFKALDFLFFLFYVYSLLWDSPKRFLNNQYGSLLTKAPDYDLMSYSITFYSAYTAWAC
jgi:hypothetical protein